MNPITIELKDIADRLHKLFPESHHITTCSAPSGMDVQLHGVGNYDAVTAMMRRLGIGTREKAIFDASSSRPWSVQRGNLDGIGITGFCSDIPPSCRIETVEVEVPEMVETGRRVMRTERVVKCGQAEAVNL